MAHREGKALRQVLNYAVACGYITDNPAKKIKNPEPKRARGANIHIMGRS